MRASNGAIEILFDTFERQGQGGSTSDQYIIVPGLDARGTVKPDDFAQTAAHSIAFHGVADLFGDGEAETRGTLIAAALGLQDESCGWYLDPGCGGQKVRSLPQSFHRDEAGPADPLLPQALSRLRPRARRAAITLRPPTVAMRAR
jgi:hypothetical protein